MRAALVEVDTGRIVQTMELPNLTHAPTGDGLAAYECGEQVTDTTHYRTHSGFAQMPARPSSHHVFDYATKTWKDPRTPATQWPVVRRQRDALLTQSDWTQLPDVPLATKEAWATYRQLLRDLTGQPDPFAIVWPQAPA